MQVFIVVYLLHQNKKAKWTETPLTLLFGNSVTNLKHGLPKREENIESNVLGRESKILRSKRFHGFGEERETSVFCPRKNGEWGRGRKEGKVPLFPSPTPHGNTCYVGKIDGNMLSCHFVLVSLFNSRHAWMDAWMIHRWNTLYFAGSIQYGKEWISSSPQHSRSDNNSPRKHDRSISIMETMCFHIEWSPQK